MIRSCVCFACCLLLAAESEGQVNVFERNRNNDAIAQRVEAQADMIRSQGEAWKDLQQGNLYYAKAREKLAEAVDRELDNWLKHVRVYYERREARERGKMAMLDVYMERTDQKIKLREERDSRVLETFDTDRKRSGAAVAKGVALNAFLDVFYRTPLSYGIELSPSMRESIGSRMDLDDQMLHDLRVRGRNRGGGTLVFRPGDAAGMDLDWWPAALRDPAFDLPRQRVERARETIVALAGDEERQGDVGAIAELEQAVGELSRSFFKSYPPNKRQQFTTGEFAKVHQAEDFLARLDHDVRRISETGSAAALRGVAFDRATDGRDMSSFVTWMIRNGLQFEESLPGEEASYEKAFAMMRELKTLMNE